MIVKATESFDRNLGILYVTYFGAKVSMMQTCSHDLIKQHKAVVLNSGSSASLGAFLRLKGALGSSKSMHSAGCYASILGSFVHLIIGAEL